MPMDFNYTSRFDKYPDERNVFHALLHCPEAEKIKIKHREYGRPPAMERRKPCEVCVGEMGTWLSSL